MGVQAIDQTIFPSWERPKCSIWSFPIPRGKYFDLLPALPLNNCIILHNSQDMIVLPWTTCIQILYDIVSSGAVHQGLM